MLRVAAVAVGGAIVDDEAHGAGGRGRIVRRVEVGDAAQRGLVVRHRGATVQGQNTGAGVPAAGDAVLVGEGQCVLAGGEASRDRDGGAGQVGVVHVTHRQAAVHRRRGAVLGVGQRRAGGCDHRGVVDCSDTDVARAGVAVGGTIVDDVADRAGRRARVVAGVDVGDGCAARSGNWPPWRCPSASSPQCLSSSWR